MDIKLALFDVDGTLVTHVTHILLDSTVDAIHQLQQQGIKVAIASGRTEYALDKEVLEKVKFDYLISSNGASVFDVEKQEYLYLHDYPIELVEDLMDKVAAVKGGLIFQYNHAGYCYLDNEGFGKGFRHYLDLNEEEVIDYTKRQDKHQQELPNHILARIPDDVFEEFIKQFPQLNFVRFLPEYYDVNAKFINKAFGLNKILTELNFNPEQVIAFGDGQNDIEMLSEVGVSVAMGNGDSNIKAMADYVTTDTDKDGIRNALLHYDLIK